MIRVPFSLPDINFGLTEVKGALYLEGEFLVFEIEKAFLGEFNPDHHIIKIEPSALKDIRLERGWMKDQICVWPKKRDLLEALPGKFVSEVPLKIRRKHRYDAEQLVGMVRQRQ